MHLHRVTRDVHACGSSRAMGLPGENLSARGPALDEAVGVAAVPRIFTAAKTRHVVEHLRVLRGEGMHVLQDVHRPHTPVRRLRERGQGSPGRRRTSGRQRCRGSCCRYLVGGGGWRRGPRGGACWCAIPGRSRLWSRLADGRRFRLTTAASDGGHQEHGPHETAPTPLRRGSVTTNREGHNRCPRYVHSLYHCSTVEAAGVKVSGPVTDSSTR